MEKLYIISGANGHVGTTIIKMIALKNEKIRGLILPGEVGKFKTFI